MENIKRLITLLLLVCTNSILFAQEERPNCTNPQKINISSFLAIEKIEEIHYQAEDKYTYWYEIYSDEEETLFYEMNPINLNDDYELLIYEKKGDDFCNELINRKVKQLSNVQVGKLTLVKNQIYLFNVVYLGGKGCGHNLELKTETNNIIIKVIHNECVEDVLEELITEKVDAEEKIIPIAEVIKKTLLQEERIKGIVINQKTKDNIEATIVIHNYAKTNEKLIYSDVDSGFVLDGLITDKIIVSVDKFGYKRFCDTVNFDSELVRIELEPISVGEKIIMKKVYFHPNTYVLKEESKTELNKLLNFMLENKKYSFEIQGHTNGNRMVKKSKKHLHLGEGWNFNGSSKKLSKLRAEKVKQFLLLNGVSDSQLKTEGYGGDKMVVKKPNNMIEAMKNIRVEVIVLQ